MRILWGWMGLWAGCSGDPAGNDPKDPVDTEDPSLPDTDEPETGPFWYGQVEPLFRQHCVGCHQTGGIGPFGLDDYETAKSWAEPAKQAMLSRSMPPWLVVDDGSCGDFADSRWLDDETLATLVAWVDAGAPEGDPALAVSDPLPPLPSLDRVDATLTTPDFLPQVVGTPEAPNDEYRCFLVEDPVADNMFLTGYEVDPGNDAIVHHLLAMVIDPAADGWDGNPNGEHIAAMDGADGREGWPCFGAAGGDIREKGTPAVWAPGMGAVELPDGVGFPIQGGDVIVIQMHYNLIDPTHLGETDQTSLHMRLEPQQDSGLRPAYLSLPDVFLESMFGPDPETIPPGESAYSFTFTLEGWEVMASSGAPQPMWFSPFQLVAVMPHMHAIGSQEELRVLREDGSEECLAFVEDWDFNWQLTYFYEQPILMNPEDQVEITCTWDSTGRTEPTYPGWGTATEMCLFSMMVVPGTGS
jgi:hypothetical protein